MSSMLKSHARVNSKTLENGEKARICNRCERNLLRNVSGARQGLLWKKNDNESLV